MNDLRKRLGKFSISTELLEQNPEAVMKIMGRCIILRAESLDYRRMYEYYAYSPHFDIISEGEYAPEYGWQLTVGGELSAHRSGMCNHNDVRRIVEDALKKVPTKVIIKERRKRGWGR